RRCQHVSSDEPFEWGVTRVFPGGALCTSPNPRKTSERGSARDRNGSRSRWLDDWKQSSAERQRPRTSATKTPTLRASSRRHRHRLGKKRGSESPACGLV